MAQCRGCATQLPDGARFCLECGRPVVAQCAGCDAPLPPQAKFCMECGTPTAAGPGAPRATSPEPTGASSRRTTSILFGDLVGFTTLSETRDAEDVRELLGRYFDECRQIVARYGGTVEKFIGDAVMAVWGVPTAHEDDAERAVRAGLELVAAVREFGEDVGAPMLALRVGVVTGEVAVTTGATQQGMVAGDAVNTAARVQSAAQPGSVYVDETTRLLTTAAITYADAGSHALKGKADPVPLWSVRAVVAATGGAQRADGLEAPLVGRDRELRLVKELFHHTQESGRPALLVIDGEPGVGKSRLAWEFEKYVDGLNDLVRWHSGRCVAYGEGVAYFALAEAVRGRLLAGLDDAQQDAPTEQLLAWALERHVPDASERDWLRDRMAALLGIGAISGFPREDLFSAWTVFFERVADDEVLTLVIDDAQHADDGLLGFLEHLITVASFPCFVMVLTRPGLLERRTTLATHRRANVIHLPTLSDRDVAALLDGLVAGLPDDVREQLVARSDGIPVFAVETVRSLIDRDLVVPRGGQYVLADGAPLDLDSLAAPASLQALIAARLDALSTEQRLVVDRGSVLGTTFAPDALADLCPEVADTAAVLASLVRLQILAQDASRMSAGYGNYRFVQTAVRQVAYGVLSRRDRRSIHLAVLAQMVARGETGEDTAAIRAQHLLDALEAGSGPDDVELRRSALDELTRASARAGGLGSPTEAARHLRTALPLADDDPTRAQVLLLLARVETDAGDFEQADIHAREAHELFVGLDDRPSAGLAVATWGESVLNGARDSETALALCEPWWEELRERDDALEAKMTLTYVITRARLWTDGDIHQIIEARLALGEVEEDYGVISDGYNGLGVYYANRGLVSLSDVLLRASVDLARRHHNPRAEALALNNLAAQENPRDLHEALSYGLDAVEVALRIGHAFQIRFGLANYFIALWTAGEWDLFEPARARCSAVVEDSADDETTLALMAMHAVVRGEAPAPPALSAVERAGDDEASLAWVRVHETAVHLGNGDLEAALATGMAGVELSFGVTGVWDDLTHLWGPTADLAVRLGDDAVVARLVELTDDGRPRLPRGLRGHRELLRARLAARDGLVEAAESAFTKAVEHYRAWGSAPSVAHARASLGRWLETQGRHDEAAAHLADARSTYERLGAVAWLADLDSSAHRSATA